MTALGQMMQRDCGIPQERVSYFGIDDMSAALQVAAKFFAEDPTIFDRAEELVREEVAAVYPQLRKLRTRLEGIKAAIYTGGAFKPFSLVRALELIGMRTALAGSQTGRLEDYEQLRAICDPGTIIVDDANPLELAQFCLEQDVDLFIGGVKERPIAYKLGIAFCDHNHERKEPLAGFVSMLNFAQDVDRSVDSPVWNDVPRRRGASRAQGA